ncbi:Flagellar motor switch protein FliN [Rickettsiales endosymbiont of Paramecium tredecaurelia]|uniref:flagellar motor switch protein FliN n=1 Tax=Candidatus Sarmatiella mevalonica TaxID=2770581 RepID=UPI0019249291|nr:flagellar motor switch protein FliN [Candidatus Sarmatiella mevalonica]MBL3284868.1 Flagellar motor switch protein FliN [Candidatus Sarmatiella mevalonica]
MTIDEDDLGIEALYDVPVEVSVVLGKTKISLGKMLQLKKNAVVELDRSVGEPVEVYVNDKMVAKGEIVIINDKIGITLTEVVQSRDSIDDDEEDGLVDDAHGIYKDES